MIFPLQKNTLQIFLLKGWVRNYDSAVTVPLAFSDS